jgi:autotransporter-associated beta strand protein
LQKKSFSEFSNPLNVMKLRKSPYAIAAIFATLFLSTARAAMSSWNVNAAGGWNDSTNWSAGIPNALGDEAIFSFDISAARTISLNGDRTVGKLTIGDPTTAFFAYTIAPGTPTTSRLIFDQGDGAAVSLSYPVTASTANNSISSAVLLKGNLTITASATTTAAQALSGNIGQDASNRSIALGGGGIVTLGGFNSYLGGTTINAGKVNANTVLSFGGGIVTVNPGGQANLALAANYANSLSLAGTGFTITETNNTQALGALRYAGSVTTGNMEIQSAGARIGSLNTTYGMHTGSLSGTGNLEINSSTANHSGGFTFTGDMSDYTGTITLRQGTFKLASLDIGGSINVVDGARLYLNALRTDGGSPVIGSDAGAIRSLTLGSLGGASVFVNPAATAATSVAGNLILNGTQTVHFTTAPAATNSVLTYTGTLTGTAAQLELPGGIATYRPGTAFQVVGGTPNSIRFDLVSESRSWTKAGSGNWNLTDLNWGTQTTETFVNGDRLTFGDFDSTVENITVTVPTGLTVAPTSLTFSNSAKNYVFSGAGIIAGTAQILKTGSGTVTIGNTGANAFSGDIRLENGTLHLAPSAALNSTRFTMTGGRFASATTGALTVNANAQLSGSVILGDTTTGRTGSVTFIGLHGFANETSISVARPVSVNFSGRNIIPAALTCATPFEGAQNANLSFTGENQLTADTTINVTTAFNTGNQVNFNGPVSDGAGSFKLSKQGIGALRLSSANFYDGGTLISGGTLSVNSPLAFGTGAVTVEGSGQAYLVAAGTYANSFSIQGRGQTLNGFSDTGESGAIHLNFANQILSGTITLTGDARIAGYFSSSNNLISGNIVESDGPWKLELGNPGSSNGTGTLRLTGNNTYSGGTLISKKIVQAFSANSLGSGEVEVSNGSVANGTTLATRVEVGAGLEISNDFHLNHGGRTNATLATLTSGAITAFPGDSTTASTVTLTGDILISKTPANGGHFAVQGLATNVLRVMGEITSAVPVILSNGIVELGGGGFGYAELQQWRDTLKLAANNGIATTAIVAQGAQAAATLDLNGYNQSLEGITRPTGTNAVSVTNNSATTASTLTLAPLTGFTYPGTFVTGSSALHLSIGGFAATILSGNSTSFSGTTTVTNGGILELTGTLGNASSSLVTESNSTLRGKGTFGGNVSLGGGTTIVIDPAVAGNLTALGNLTVTGPVAVNLTNAPSGPVVVMSCTGTLTASAANFSAPAYPGASFSVVGNQVVVTVSAETRTWTGVGGNTWDINNTTNWRNGVTAATFANGAEAVFNDTVASNQNIELASTIQSSRLSFANTDFSYTFTDASAGLIQAGSLVKNGAGRVTFNVPVTCATGMTINAGTVAISSPDFSGSLPNLTSSLTGAGTLAIAAGLNNPITVSGANGSFSGSLAVTKGNMILSSSASSGTAAIAIGEGLTAPTDEPQLSLASGVTITNAVTASSSANLSKISGPGLIGGAGSITMNGPGVLEVANANTYTAATTVVAGTLRLRAVNAIAAASTVILGTAASGDNDTVLELPAGASDYQSVLSSPLVLGAAATSSEAILKKTFGTSSSFDGAVTLNGRTLRIASSGIRFGGAITGNGNLVVDTGDVSTPVILNSTASDFVGNITVLSGTLQSSASGGVRNCIPDTSSVSLGADTVLAVGASDAINELSGNASSIVRSANTGVILTLGSGNTTFAYDGQIQNGAAAFTVAKTGTGTLTLNGDSSHTGSLQVKGGTVLLNGNSAARLELDAGAVFGGNGSISNASIPAGGHIPLYGTIAPGGPAVGTLTIGNSIALYSASMQLSIADWNSIAPGTGHDLLVCPNIIFASGNLTVKLDCAGMTNFSETPKSFTVVQANQQQFGPGINTQTFQVTNFEGTGSWRILAQGNTLQLVYTPAPYLAWAALKGLTAANNGVEADPDNDGISNLQEYYFDGNPLSGSSSPLPQMASDANYVIFRFQRRDDAEAEMSAQVAQYSSTLTNWNTLPIPATSVAADGNGVIVNVAENGTSADDVEIKIPIGSVPGRIFARVQITKP